ncbi:hypothetical protein V1512DRAFT_259054 [Lipomyces arxii]|uniref:uncharacterized protein n=1 Tax=Lipomyces arxii TaxID=56418 RepID=UPI0034CED045
MTDFADKEIDDLINNLDNEYFASVPSANGRQVQKGKDLAKLLVVWQAERTCPDILRYETELLDNVLDLLRQQVEVIEIAHTTDEINDKEKFEMLLIETELERVKFIIRGYIRARIHKIDLHMMHILHSEGTIEKLSQTEQQYVRRREVQLRRFYGVRFLDSLPQKLQRLDDTAGMIPMIERPDLDAVVFVRILRDVESTIDVGDEDELELKSGNIYVLPYRFIRHQVTLGHAQLV